MDQLGLDDLDRRYLRTVAEVYGGGPVGLEAIAATLGLDAGIASHQWKGADAGHLRHSALMFMLGQTDGGVCCPMSMTYVASAALQNEPSLFDEWSPRLNACE